MSQDNSAVWDRRHVLVAIGALTATAGAALAWRQWQPEFLSASVQASLWSTQMQDVTGQESTLANFRAEQVMINFWATWCAPCVEEMPLINRFYQQNLSKNWQVVGVAIDKPSAVKRFLTQYPVQYPILLAGLNGSELMKLLGNEKDYLPFTIVLSANGRVFLRKAGKLTDEILATLV